MRKLNIGSIIAFEGIDASGKQTQSEMLLNYLKKEKKVNSQKISFPVYSTPIGQEIKSFLSGKRPGYNFNVKHMLFAANRWEMKEKIDELLDERYVVLLNRYIYSGIAYGVAHGLEFGWVESLERGLPKPMLTFFLDIEPRVSFERKSSKKRDAFEKDLAFLQRVRNVYLALAEDGQDWVKLDGHRSIDDLHKIICEMTIKVLSL
jgi:dTMP kinase